MNIQQAMELALQHHQAGRLDVAESIYRQVLAQQPRYADGLHLLGVVLWSRGQLQMAGQLIAQAIEIDPNSALYHNNLGLILTQENRLGEAIIALDRAAELAPQLAEIPVNLGLALARQNRLPEAIAAYRRGLQLDPNHGKALNNLGNALLLVGQADEAIKAFERALSIKPQDAAIWSNLTDALVQVGQLDRAIDASRKALALNPNLPEAWNHLGNALRQFGQPEQAIRAYRDALRADPKDALIHSNLIYAMHFDPSATGASIAQEHARWWHQHGAGFQPMVRPADYSRDPDRPLRVGYVSPDFRFQAECFFVLPLLESHDHNQFEIHCYASVHQPDKISDRMKKHADGWQDVRHLSDSELARKIRDDKIDILIDLTMHMADNRLPVFAEKSAPVQVTWLAYPGGTGLETMDYRITDAFMDPPGSDRSWCTEESIRLPDSWCCYDPLIDSPTISESPTAAGGNVTFGSLNSFCKVSDAVLRLWARVVCKVQGSRLLLLCPEGQCRQHILATLDQLGVNASRVEMVRPCLRPEYLQIYHRIDVMLDPFPYNGITTTCDAIWMGVPVVTLVGELPAARAGLSLLSNLGLPELAANNEQEYVQIASHLANDRARLTELRQTLRQRMEASPLMDGPRFARGFENALRQAWRTWCNTPNPQLSPR
jgi:protein O-GlcNAc transferase